MTPPIADTAELYRALCNRDASYLGSFVAGVKTTGIFCLPTCRARKPKAENVEFFEDAGAALRAGYRPCKICRPTEELIPAPDEVTRAMQLLQEGDAPRVRDQDLRAAGLHPETVRRHFKRVYRMTFHAYQRMLRLNAAYRALQRGEGVLEAGLEGKYDSSSGFYRAYERVMRQTPAAGARARVITLSHIDTPLGPMIAGATDEGLCLLEFTDRRMLETQLDTLVKRLGARFLYGNHRVIEQVREELSAYFAGILREFTVPLQTPGTPFQNLVWQQLREIPYASTRSYAEQAQAIGRPNAVRAVAAANGQKSDRHRDSLPPRCGVRRIDDRLRRRNRPQKMAAHPRVSARLKGLTRLDKVVRERQSTIRTKWNEYFSSWTKTSASLHFCSESATELGAPSERQCKGSGHGKLE